MFAKKIVAGAALLAMAAAAQAQVKVYGYLELGVGSYKSAGAAKSVTAVSSGNMMTSFLGFAGSEDLGGGLKAEFTLETFIGADTGAFVPNNAGQFWGRGSNIALSGGFGKVALGQYDTPLFVAGLSYNPFGSSMMFSPTMRHYYGFGIGLTGQTAGTTNFAQSLTTDTGWVNSVTYETPNFGGFMATLQWSPKESPAATAEDSFTIGASYNAGPLSLMGVYGDHGLSTAYTGKQKVFSLNGSYDFGVAKAFLQYTDVDNSNTSVDDTLFQIGASVPVTAQGTVLVSYGQLKRDTAPNDTTNKIFSLGYDHSLSKRTGVYAALTSERHTALKTGNSFAVGIKHSF